MTAGWRIGIATLILVLGAAACSTVSTTTMRCRVSFGAQSKTVPIKMVGTKRVPVALGAYSFTFWTDNSDLHVDVRGPSGAIMNSVGGLSGGHFTPGGNVGYTCRP